STVAPRGAGLFFVGGWGGEGEGRTHSSRLLRRGPRGGRIVHGRKASRPADAGQDVVDVTRVVPDLGPVAKGGGENPAVSRLAGPGQGVLAGGLHLGVALVEPHEDPAVVAQQLELVDLVGDGELGGLDAAGGVRGGGQQRTGDRVGRVLDD